MNKNGQKIWFIADPHFYHKNILKYCKGRIPKIKEWAAEHGFVVTNDNIVDIMNMWIIDVWNSTVSKHDKVYILGDFSFGTRVENEKLLDKLNGKKYLILGNHDGNSDTLYDRFEYIRGISELKVDYKSGNDTVCFELCHYPMRSWNRMEHGTIQLHGHCHNNMSKTNFMTGELRVDIGFDSDLADYGLVSPEMVIEYFNRITDGKTYREYARQLIRKNYLQKVLLSIKNSFKYKKFVKKLREITIYTI